MGPNCIYPHDPRRVISGSIGLQGNAATLHMVPSHAQIIENPIHV